jgi:hypothetical protein
VGEWSPFPDDLPENATGLIKHGWHNCPWEGWCPYLRIRHWLAVPQCS